MAGLICIVYICVIVVLVLLIFITHHCVFQRGTCGGSGEPEGVPCLQQPSIWWLLWPALSGKDNFKWQGSCFSIWCYTGLILGLHPSQWETALRSNAVSHWLGANLESALINLVIKLCKSWSLNIYVGTWLMVPFFFKILYIQNFWWLWSRNKQNVWLDDLCNEF